MSDIAKVMLYFLAMMILLSILFEETKTLIKKIRRYNNIKKRLKKEETAE